MSFKRKTMGIGIFFSATALIAYLLFGYPLLLRWERRRAPAVMKDPAFRSTVTVLMAVHNGEKFIEEKLESLLALKYPSELVEIIVVCDGCTDGTASVVQRYSDRGVQLLKARRGGKAAAINMGLQYASGEMIFFTDVRQPLDPSALAHLIANFADPTVGAVTGELRLPNSDIGEQANMNLYWRYELWARERHSTVDSVFNATGCIYAIRRSLARPIPRDTIADDAVLPLRSFFQGYRVVFDHEAVAYDYPALPGTEFRRRMRILAGLWQVYARMPQLFSKSNRMRFHFLSHKFGRLVLPWAVLTAMGASLVLPPSSFRQTLWLLEGAFLALALLDVWIPNAFPLKRISSPARMFVLMNTASLLAIQVFFVRPQSLWTATRVNASGVQPR